MIESYYQVEPINGNSPMARAAFYHQYMKGTHAMADSHYMPPEDESQDNGSALAPSEKHLEDWIYNNSQEFFTKAPTVWGRRIIGKQIPISSGRIDILVAAKLGLRILELKKGRVDGSAVSQLIRYTGELEDLFLWADCHVTGLDDPHYYDNSLIPSVYPSVAGILIGHSFDKNALLACYTNKICAIQYQYSDGEYEFEEVCADLSIEHRELWRTDVGAAVREAMRHRRLFLGDRDALIALYREEGSV